MRWYTRISDIPELRDCPADVRHVAFNACKWRTFRSWQMWVALLASWVFFVTAWALIRPRSAVTMMVLLAVCGGVLGVPQFFLLTNLVRPHLREYLARNWREGAGA